MVPRSAPPSRLTPGASGCSSTLRVLRAPLGVCGLRAGYDALRLIRLGTNPTATWPGRTVPAERSGAGTVSFQAVGFSADQRDRDDRIDADGDGVSKLGAATGPRVPVSRCPGVPCISYPRWYQRESRTRYRMEYRSLGHRDTWDTAGSVRPGAGSTRGGVSGKCSQNLGLQSVPRRRRRSRRVWELEERATKESGRTEGPCIRVRIWTAQDMKIGGKGVRSSLEPRREVLWQA